MFAPCVYVCIFLVQILNRSRRKEVIRRTWIRQGVKNKSKKTRQLFFIERHYVRTSIKLFVCFLGPLQKAISFRGLDEWKFLHTHLILASPPSEKGHKFMVTRGFMAGKTKPTHSDYLWCVFFSLVKYSKISMVWQWFFVENLYIFLNFAYLNKLKIWTKIVFPPSLTCNRKKEGQVGTTWESRHDDEMIVSKQEIGGSDSERKKQLTANNGETKLSLVSLSRASGRRSSLTRWRKWEWEREWGASSHQKLVNFRVL